MSTILHSIYGKMFGVDASGYITGPTGAKFPEYRYGASGSENKVTALSTPIAVSSTGETLGAGGHHRVAPSSAAVYTMPTPSGTGKMVSIFQDSASTSCTINISSGNGSFQTTQGTSMFNIIMKARGAGVMLIDGSTIWDVVVIRGTTDSVHLTS